MTRLEEIKKEYEYVEPIGICKECKYYRGLLINSLVGSCSKIGIEVRCYGGCRKYDKKN